MQKKRKWIFFSTQSMYQNLLNSADRNKNAVFRHGVYVEIKTILAFLTTFSM